MKSINKATQQHIRTNLSKTFTRSNNMKNNETITCPHCNEHIDMTDLIKDQISKELHNSHQAEFENQTAKYEQKLKKQRNEQRELAKSYADKKVKEAKEFTESQMSDLVDALKKDLSETNEKLKRSHVDAATLERVKRDYESKFAKHQADVEQKNSIMLQEEIEKEKLLIETRNEVLINKKMADQELTVIGLRKQLDQQKKLTADMQRKQEQGSQQLQGEVQELAIEQWLHLEYPQDDIKEIKKGRNGADTLHTVYSPDNIQCGSILLESKNTRAWQNDWIPKLRADMLDAKADIGVIVTQTLPKNIKRFGLEDGIWICSFRDYKILVALHREAIIDLKKISLRTKNRGTMKERLYDFVTSKQYQARIQDLVRTFIEMQEMLDKEKRTQKMTWKIREKHLENVMFSTTDMYGSIKGIAGNSVKTISELESFSDEELESLEEEDKRPLISTTLN
ncbi:MAG: DUF2130 domain-containing protein [Porticoccaceae bacterium]|nr:DUF2130 domain-containing protein [Porticoccaceae bacterium]